VHEILQASTHCAARFSHGGNEPVQLDLSRNLCFSHATAVLKHGEEGPSSTKLCEVEEMSQG
jgi:hypothetical protein